MYFKIRVNVTDFLPMHIFNVEFKSSLIYSGYLHSVGQILSDVFPLSRSSKSDTTSTSSGISTIENVVVKIVFLNKNNEIIIIGIQKCIIFVRKNIYT